MPGRKLIASGLFLCLRLSCANMCRNRHVRASSDPPPRGRAGERRTPESLPDQPAPAHRRRAAPRCGDAMGARNTKPRNPATQRPSNPATQQPGNSVPSDLATQHPATLQPGTLQHCNTATLQPSTLHPTPFVFGGSSPAFRRLMPEIPQIATSRPAIEPNRVAICPKPCRLFPIRGLLPGGGGALRRILAKTWHRVRKTWQRRRLDSLSRPCGATAPMRGRARSPS